MKYIELPYIYDRAGIDYFYKRIPKDLERHYKCPKVVIFLRTRSLRAAKAKTATLSAQLDEEWLTLRWSRNNDVLSRYRTSSDVPSLIRSDAPLISKAKNVYLYSKGDGRPVTFAQAVDRSINNLINIAGDKPIDTYSRQDAKLPST
tara:strand:- start:32 stop:472 length:441 start_codon:yes stop_codon:yes gene_type:complete